MIVEGFFDTNLLIYAVGKDGEAPKKMKRVRALMQSIRWAWSVQVAQEFYVNVTRKRKGEKPLTHLEALVWLEAFDYAPMQENTKGCLALALELKERFQLSLWDANILAAASLVRSPVVYSEDLNHGQQYNDVQVINPFRGSGNQQ